MNTQQLRLWLAILVLGGFTVVSCLIVIFIITGLLPTPDGLKILKTFFSIYSGIIGVIIGYFFGKNSCCL